MEFLRKLSPRGQKLFRDISGKFYICDYSGRTPHDTDDGPLQIIDEKACLLSNHGNVYVTVRVQIENRLSSVSISMHEYITLMQYTNQKLFDKQGNQISIVLHEESKICTE